MVTRSKGTRAQKAPKASERMPDPITLRLPPALLARIDALVPKLAGAGGDMQLLLTSVTRADVLRVVLAEGVKVLERRYVK